MAEEKTGPVTDPTDKNKGPGAKEPRKGQLLTPEQLAERMSQGVPDYFAPSQATSIIQTGIEPSQYDDRYSHRQRLRQDYERADLLFLSSHVSLHT